MLRSIYNYVRYRQTRRQAEKIMSGWMPNVAWESDNLCGYEHISDAALTIINSFNGIYPDLTLKYANRVMTLAPDARGESVMRALFMISDHAFRAARMSPDLTRQVLTDSLTFSEQFPHMHGTIKGILERLDNPVPHPLAAAPAR